MKIGILGCADIAFRRFLPALRKCPGVEYAGVASRTPSRAAPFQAAYGGRIFDSYEALLEAPEIDAVYLPLPPALHGPWGQQALEHGKHILMEKPFSVSSDQTEQLLNLAAEKGLAVHENYMFLYHSQLAWIKEQIRSGVIGELRLIRAAFCFPFRGQQDFRYDRQLGGGALLDCGGYPVCVAGDLLGPTTRVVSARLHSGRGLSVDLYGSATLENEDGLTAQIAFGMDNQYRCELEVLGSTASVAADRIFTAPPDLTPPVRILGADGAKALSLPADDAFLNSISYFLSLTQSEQARSAHYEAIRKQSTLIHDIQTVGVMR